MSSLANDVRARVSDECLTTKCENNRCKVGLPNDSSLFVVINMDHPKSPAPKDKEHCDHLFIGECSSSDWVVPIELKGRPKASKIVSQLQAGASVASKIVPNRAKVKFKPIAVYDGQFRRAEVDAFREKRNKVKFRQQREFILLRERELNLEKDL